MPYEPEAQISYKDDYYYESNQPYLTPHFGSLEGPSGMASVSSTGKISPKDVLDKYELLNLVGKGSMSKQLQVRDKDSGYLRTLDIRSNSFKSNKDEIVQALDHPFIPKILETAISNANKVLANLLLNSFF